MSDIEVELPEQDERLVPGVSRIAVLKATALGDFIQTLPALEAVRRAYPAAVITLLARDWHRELLAGRPGPVDEVAPIPHGALGDEVDGLRPDERERFFATLDRHFDIALQMHGGGRNSNPFIRRLGARLTAGARTADALPLDRTIAYDLYQPDVLRNVEIAALVGATRAPLEPRLAVVDADIAASLAIMPASDRPLVVLHPGASDSRRRWPVDRFAALGDALAGAGAQVCVTGVASEAQIAADVRARAQHELVDLAGRLSLSALVGLLARATLVVTNDTGPRHVAAAVGTATVSIYWIGNLITAGPLTRARHRVLLSWRLACPVCGRNCITDSCDHRASFVADVGLADVRAQALELLEAESAAMPPAAHETPGEATHRRPR